MSQTDEPIAPGLLEKVRALLAKAESTSFPAEAEALTAKAQELMTRHRIEQAMLDATGAGRTVGPTKRRIVIPDPYAGAKSLLLAGIADANGCRMVWSSHDRVAHVFGFDDELAVVEELFTSLLVQATGALAREGSKRDAFGRSRTKRFRRAFLLAFGVRISQRLRETVASTVDDAGTATGVELVPLLADRVAETEAALRAAFPRTRSMSVSINDGEGWRAGTAFGERANLRLGTERLTA